MDNQRKHERKKIISRVFVNGVELTGDVWFYSDDISAGGLYLVSDFLIEKGTEILLSFRLPGLTAPLSISGRVAWVNLGTDPAMKRKPPGMGIEFRSADPAAAEAIKNFLTQEE